MKPFGHALSALPFAATGHYAVALGCFLPDAVWLINEYRFRRSGWESVGHLDRGSSRMLGSYPTDCATAWEHRSRWRCWELPAWR